MKQNILVYGDFNVAFKAKCPECLQKSFLSQIPSLLVQSWGRKEGHRDMAASKPHSLSRGETVAFASSLCNTYMGLVRAHLAAEKLHQKIPPQHIFMSLTNPST